MLADPAGVMPRGPHPVRHATPPPTRLAQHALIDVLTGRPVRPVRPGRDGDEDRACADPELASGRARAERSCQAAAGPSPGPSRTGTGRARLA